METKTGNYFICSVVCETVAEDGTPKKVKRAYVEEAASFADAEYDIVKDINDPVLEIVDISRAPFSEIFFSDRKDDDMRHYKVKVSFISVDDSTGKERKYTVYYLSQGTSTKDAQRVTDAVLGGLMDYKVEAIVETRIIDLFLEQ